ncbi:MAG TPA: hypothetical protein VHO28_14470 [Ignavibacteriales bacterium]|nr:hypothetical protein [Ignavibacteriales bacterium]
MKIRFLTSFLLLAIVSSVFPQGMTGKGSRSISGSFTIMHTTWDDTESRATEIILSPGYSYFAADNFELGASLSFRYSELKDEYIGMTYTSISRSFGFGPFAAYYFGKSSSKPFLIASLTYATPLHSNSYNLFALAFGAGYLIPLNQKAAITPFIEYEFRMYDKDTMNDSKSLTVGAQLKMFL